MAITIAKLSTISSLDSTQFSAGLGKMQIGLSKFGAVSFGAFARIGGMITDFTRRAVTALPRMVLHSLEAGDALNELASQLGFSTVALANLQRVAGLSGITDLETIIGKMNTTLGEAVTGNKAAAQSFADLGLSAASLADKKPEEAFFAILDALKQIPGVARQSAAAVGVFGRGGRAMLKLVGLGSAGIGAEGGRTRGLGIASRSGDLASMDRANDTLADLRNNLKGFGDQLALRLAPKIADLGQEFLGFSSKMNLAGNAAEYMSQTAQTAALAIAGIADTILNAAPGKGILYGKFSNIQGNLFNSLQRANQQPSVGGSTMTAPAPPPLTYGEILKRNRIERQKGGGVRRWKEDRADFLRHEIDRVKGNTSEFSPLTGPQNDYLQSLIEELKKNTQATKENTDRSRGGGARP